MMSPQMPIVSRIPLPTHPATPMPAQRPAVLPATNNSAWCRTASAPRTRYASISNANTSPLFKRTLRCDTTRAKGNPPKGRVLYTEQDRMRDLTTLASSKNNLIKFMDVNQTAIKATGARYELQEMRRLGAKIETLQNLIVHSDPCSTETDKFQREANLLKSLAQYQISTPPARPNGRNS